MRWSRGLALALTCAILALGVGGCADRSDGLTTTHGEVASTVPSSTTTTEYPELSPDTWVEMKPAGQGPAARYGHCAVWDPVAARMIVFGGANYSLLGWRDGPFFRDLWAYDPAQNSWTELEQAGDVPPGRIYGAMAYDPDSRRVFLFGGEDHDEVLNDTWAYDPDANEWARLNPGGAVPLGRAGHAMVYDPVGRRLILFGGRLSEDLSRNTWAYDPAANTWSEVPPKGPIPPARIGHSLVYDSDMGRIFLFGGTARLKQVTAGNDPTGYVNDVWVFDVTRDRWAEPRLMNQGPVPREFCGLVYEPASKEVILFGGRGEEYLEMDSTWVFDVEARRWKRVARSGAVPTARHSMTMVYDPVEGVVIMYGGYSEIDELGDVWTYAPSGYRPQTD